MEEELEFFRLQQASKKGVVMLFLLCCVVCFAREGFNGDGCLGKRIERRKKRRVTQDMLKVDEGTDDEKKTPFQVARKKKEVLPHHRYLLHHHHRGGTKHTQSLAIISGIQTTNTTLKPSTIPQPVIMIQRTFLLLLALTATVTVTVTAFATSSSSKAFLLPKTTTISKITTILQMSDSGGGGADVSKSTKKGKGLQTITIDKVEAKEDQEEVPEEQWRVVLHNDEVHTFNYVIQSLCKCIGTLDRKRAFDICVVTHGEGKATITKSWKEQAMKYCLGLQRQGLTASIAPENRFTGDGDGGGGGEPDAGGGQ